MSFVLAQWLVLLKITFNIGNIQRTKFLQNQDKIEFDTCSTVGSVKCNAKKIERDEGEVSSESGQELVWYKLNS